MDRKELLDQYDRFIEQIRTEAKDLYWLYNFFFVIESAVLGAVFAGKIESQYLVLVKISGFFLALYWFIIIRKQRMWRNSWVLRVQVIEDKLGYSDDMKMWKPKKKRKLLTDYILGRKGMWRFLFILPMCFGLIWIVLLIKKSI